MDLGHGDLVLYLLVTVFAANRYRGWPLFPGIAGVKDGSLAE